MKLTIEIETDDLSILKLIAKAAYVKPAPSNDPPSGEDIPRVPDNWNALKAASRLREVCQPHSSASQK